MKCDLHLRHALMSFAATSFIALMVGCGADATASRGEQAGEVPEGATLLSTAEAKAALVEDGAGAFKPLDVPAGARVYLAPPKEVPVQTEEAPQAFLAPCGYLTKFWSKLSLPHPAWFCEPSIGSDSGTSS